MGSEFAREVTVMLTSCATAQVAQLVEQGTEKVSACQLYPSSVVDRFDSNVDRSAGLLACHPWKLTPTSDGYGDFWIGGTRHIPAHRFALELKLNRHLRADEVSRHAAACTTRLCCNEEHLCHGSAADNVADRVAAGRSARGERNGRSRLTEARVLEARHRCAAGESPTALAREFGVDYQAVRRAVLKITWTHVGGAA